MSHDRQSDEFPFAGLAPPGPPEELRGKVLALARGAFERESTHDVWTRIWESRRLRIAWAAAAALLVMANLGVSFRRPSGGTVASRAGAGAGTEGEKESARELAAVVAISPIDESVQPLAGRNAASTSSPEREPVTRRGGLS